MGAHEQHARRAARGVQVTHRSSNAEKRAARKVGEEAARQLRARRTWEKSLRSSIEFLERLHSMPGVGGQAWREKMRAHYGQLAQDALRTVPLGAERAALEWQRRLDRC
jgi:hypothetical protein